MGTPENEAHRPGAFKQPNKAHKHGRHKSKGELANQNKGKVSVKNMSRVSKQLLSKQNRRNQLIQSRKNKRGKTLMKKRQLGSMMCPPFLVGIIPLNPNMNPDFLLELIKECDEDITVTESNVGHIHISVRRFKQRFTFVLPSMNNFHCILDLAKVADTLLLLHPLGDDFDTSEGILSVLFAQGLPSTVHVLQGLNDIPAKKRHNVKKQAQKNLEKRFPDEKLHVVDTSSDALLILRHIGNQKQRTVTQRDIRPHLIANSFEFVPYGNDENEGTLKVNGYIRGQPLDVNGLVHIPGCGDFQLEQIDLVKDPHPLILGSSNLEDMGEVTVLAKADPSTQVSLESENIPDAMDGEQTWPTEEELMEAGKALKKKQITRRVPKGMSNYQAAWILDSDAEDGEEERESIDSDEEMLHGDLEAMEEVQSDDGKSQDSDQEEYETVTVNENGEFEKYDEKLDMDEESMMLEKFRQQRLDRMFPDEIDTPTDKSARVRFQKYRGLKSFNSSYWDPKENLPSEYARIFQFENINRTKKRIFKEEREGVMPGWYVTLNVTGVKKNVVENFTPGKPLVIIGLLPHEHKVSVLNMVIKRYPGFDEPIKSKEYLIFHIAGRRFRSCAVFSAHTNGTKHKFERFLPDKGSVVATVFAPITFTPASVMVYKEEQNGSHTLAATGMVLSMNPDRIIAKRVVLSGHLYRIHKKSAVVRYMFFNCEDINWFKPVELKTKYGRRGHIKDTLGTHGHMKCVFDGTLKSEDTVLLHLYKRVFPKWSYDPYVPEPLNSEEQVMED